MINEVNLEKIAKEDRLRYIDYVNFHRAFPSVIDGLKEVQRRVLFVMHKNKIHHNTIFRKVATIVGLTMAYHPHGDSSIDSALVRLAQDFEYNYPLLDGHGNFGSLSGDPAAASRYISAKLSEFSDKVVLQDLVDGIVEFQPNYDETSREPVVLATKLPLLLINGSSGVGSGFKCEFIPHNAYNVLKLCIEYVKNRNMSIKEAVDILGYPDVPTGGVVTYTSNTFDVYKRGTGSITITGDYKIDDRTIIISSLPYGINTTNFLNQVSSLISTDILDVKSVDDYTNKDGVDIRITINGDVYNALDVLLKKTNLEKKYTLISNAVNGDKFKTYTLLDIMSEFVDFRSSCIYNSSMIKKEKLEILKSNKTALITVFNDLDNAIRIIKKSNSRSNCIEALIKAYKFSQSQAEYIADLSLYRLNKTDIEEVKKELKEIVLEIKRLKDITSSKSNKFIDEVMIQEWMEIEAMKILSPKRKSKLRNGGK